MSRTGSTEFGNTRQIPPAKHWCFTYNNYKEEDIYRIIELISSNNKENTYIFQQELSDEGTRHLQGYINFRKKIRPKGLFKEFNTIHWEKTLNVKNAIRYCHKKESRDGETFANIKYDRDVRTLDRQDMYDWQEEIVGMTDIRAGDRIIHWYWEPEGNKGKTALCKWLAVHKEALVLSGKAADMKYGVVKYKEKRGYYPDIILFDIPRSMADYVSWAGIEGVKNGLFFSPKYESDMVVFNCPHVICFTNSLPEMKNLSEDRWNIRRIGEFVTPVSSWSLRRFGPL